MGSVTLCKSLAVLLSVRRVLSAACLYAALSTRIATGADTLVLPLDQMHAVKALLTRPTSQYPPPVIDWKQAKDDDFRLHLDWAQCRHYRGWFSPDSASVWHEMMPDPLKRHYSVEDIKLVRAAQSPTVVSEWQSSLQVMNLKVLTRLPLEIVGGRGAKGICELLTVEIAYRGLSGGAAVQGKHIYSDIWGITSLGKVEWIPKLLVDIVPPTTSTTEYFGRLSVKEGNIGLMAEGKIIFLGHR